MTLQALIATVDPVFSLKQFPIPPLQPTEVLVRTLYSGVSVGTEFMVFQGRLDWGPFPVCTGYQATGEVVGIGSAVDRFREGDVVYYRSNSAPLILNGTEVNRCSATHADFAVVPQDQDIELLPEGVDSAVGAMFVMPSVGWNAVDMAGIQMDELVAMQGLGLIGTGAMLAARLRGARVVGIELDERRMQLARNLGIDHIIDARTEDVEAAIEAIQPGGADVAFEATGLPQNLDSAFRLARRHGRFVYLGNLGSAPVSFNFTVPHSKMLTCFFPCNDGLKPCRDSVLRNIASGALPWGKTISHIVDAQDAPELYRAIDNKSIPELTGAVIKWN